MVAFRNELLVALGCIRRDYCGDFEEDCRGTFKEDYRGDFKEEIDNSSVPESSQRARTLISFAFSLWYSKFL